MDSDSQVIYERLKDLARHRRTSFYEDLAELIDLPPRDRRFYKILDDINLLERGEGRPLLSALVVRRGYRIPGNGFFTQARNLGAYSDDGDATTSAAFWVAEVQRIWDFWGATV